METVIYSKVTDGGMHSIYARVDGKPYYLFSQNYRRGVRDYFGGGVYIDRTIDFSRAHGDAAVIRTMSKIPVYVKYIEKEYGITVLNQTKKKRDRVTHCKSERTAG